MDLRLPYKTGSAFHCSLFLENGGLKLTMKLGGKKIYIKDESSLNGTFVEFKGLMKVQVTIFIILGKRDEDRMKIS